MEVERKNFVIHLIIILITFWANDKTSTRYTYFSCRELGLAIDFLIDNIYVRFGSSVFRQVVGIPMGTNSAPLLADLFPHTFEYDFVVKTMKQDITKLVHVRARNLILGVCIIYLFKLRVHLVCLITS